MAKKYTPRTLRAAVRRYFDSISREVTVTEKVPTGQKDQYGHEIFEDIPVINKLGKEMCVTEYMAVPQLGKLCIFLKINPSTWSRWRDEDKYPEFKDIIEDVDNRMKTWRLDQVATRAKPQGLIWDLEVNYGAGKNRQEERSIELILTGEMAEYGG